MRKTKKYSKKTILLILAGILVLCACSAAAYQLTRPDATSETDKNTTAQTSDDKINLDPATEDDAKRAEDNKQRIVDESKQATEQSSTGTKKSVSPIITYGDQPQPGSQVEVYGYVAGVFEDGGTCTATFSRDGTTFTRTVGAVKNVSSMNCPTIAVPVSEFNPKGNWSVTLGYSSESAAGTSSAKQLGVQ